MQPYDWCNPSCPDPCWCQETIEKNIEEEKKKKKKECDSIKQK